MTRRVRRAIPKPPRRPDAFLALCDMCDRYERPLWLHAPSGEELCHDCALELGYPTSDLERVI